MKEQQNKLTLADKKIQQAKDRLKEVQQFNVEGGIEVHMKKMEEENKANRFAIQNMSHDIQEKRQWAEKLRKVLNEPTMTENEKSRMVNTISTLKADIKKLMTKRDSSVKYRRFCDGSNGLP
jgi:hypothetical protein